MAEQNPYFGLNKRDFSHIRQTPMKKTARTQPHTDKFGIIPSENLRINFNDVLLKGQTYNVVELPTTKGEILYDFYYGGKKYGRMLKNVFEKQFGGKYEKTEPVSAEKKSDIEMPMFSSKLHPETTPDRTGQLQLTKGQREYIGELKKKGWQLYGYIVQYRRKNEREGFTGTVVMEHPDYQNSYMIVTTSPAFRQEPKTDIDKQVVKFTDADNLRENKIIMKKKLSLTEAYEDTPLKSGKYELHAHINGKGIGRARHDDLNFLIRLAMSNDAYRFEIYKTQPENEPEKEGSAEDLVIWYDETGNGTWAKQAKTDNNIRNKKLRGGIVRGISTPFGHIFLNETEGAPKEEKIFKWKDKSGRGFTADKLTKTKIMNTWGEELEKEDWNGRTIGDFVENCYIGDVWENATERLECVQMLPQKIHYGANDLDESSPNLFMKNNGLLPDNNINEMENIDEKSVSKKQQRFMGMVHAIQKGEMSPKDVGTDVAKAAKEMSPKDAEDFASTKHKGLPEKVKEKQSEGLKLSNFIVAENIAPEDKPKPKDKIKSTDNNAEAQAKMLHQTNTTDTLDEWVQAHKNIALKHDMDECSTGKKKYKVTEEQMKRLNEIRLMRESMRKMGALITEEIATPITYTPEEVNFLTSNGFRVRTGSRDAAIPNPNPNMKEYNLATIRKEKPDRFEVFADYPHNYSVEDNIQNAVKLAVEFSKKPKSYFNESENVLDELSPQTYMGTRTAGLQRGDPRGVRIAKTAIINLLKPYEGEVFQFIGDSGEHYRAGILPQETATQSDMFENNIARLIMKFSSAEGGGDAEYYIVSIDSNGGVGATIHGGGKSTRLISTRRTANMLAKIYNDMSLGSGERTQVTPNQFAQR